MTTWLAVFVAVSVFAFWIGVLLACGVKAMDAFDDGVTWRGGALIVLWVGLFAAGCATVAALTQPHDQVHAEAER